ncbi:hypothetical protein [Flaviflexus equikiangi]|uniref:Uncharacterized protein n=1 Tax=Flaviflexus equikiangi TaxID=2758573 RepID=A0ABS2TDL9_9ACTO|nr:hypothetical protein [Flaviflexus equikiangi]MBM9432750.1 hypothetical protein [Flaviflexus equikiangi]
MTGLLIASLTAIGGGSDSVQPAYVDDVHFGTEVVARSDVSDSLEAHISTYEDMFDMTWDEAYLWYLGEDNREHGLVDVSERFSAIYEGYSVLDGNVTVWVSSPAKSGGIIDLLDDYAVDADVRLMPGDSDASRAAYRFVADFGTPSYYAAELDDSRTGLVILTSSRYAADMGPTLYGTVIDGVLVDYHYSE